MVKLLRGVQLSEIEAATSKGVTTSLDETLFKRGAYCVLHAKVGAISFTVTRNEHETVLLPASFAEKITVVVPIGNELPDANPEVRVTESAPVQLSDAVGVAKLKGLVH